VADAGSTGTPPNPSMITGFTINSDESLTAISPTITGSTTNLGSPLCLIIDRTGSFLYATNNSNNNVSAYTIDQTSGALTPLAAKPTIPTGTGPQLGALDPSGTHLYVANFDGGTTNTVSAYSIVTGSNAGVLTHLGDTAITGAVGIFNLVVDPTGTYLYVLDGGGSTAIPTGQVFGFKINSDGSVPSTPIAGTPVLTGVGPAGGIVVDPTSSILAVDNEGDGTISVYTIAPSTGTNPGSLTNPATVNSGTNSGSSPLFVTLYNAP